MTGPFLFFRTKKLSQQPVEHNSMNLTQRLKKDSGVTTLELCVAMAICAFVALTSIPSLKNYAAAASLQSEAQRIATTLELCTVKALFHRDEVRMTLQNFELTAHRLSNPKKPLLKRALRAGIKLNLGRGELRFYSTGTVTPTTAILSNGAQRCVIRLSLRGRTTVECEKGR